MTEHSLICQIYKKVEELERNQSLILEMLAERSHRKRLTLSETEKILGLKRDAILKRVKDGINLGMRREGNKLFFNANKVHQYINQ